MDHSPVDEIIVMGDPHVIGTLRPLLSKRASEKVKSIIPKNLFHAGEPEIRQHAQQGY